MGIETGQTGLRVVTLCKESSKGIDDFFSRINQEALKDPELTKIPKWPEIDGTVEVVTSRVSDMLSTTSMRCHGGKTVKW